MRISIEVTSEQHQRLKAIAALHGQSIKEYILERVLPKQLPADEDEALVLLEAFLEPRIRAAKNGSTVSQSVEQIFDEVRRQAAK